MHICQSYINETGKISALKNKINHGIVYNLPIDLYFIFNNIFKMHLF